MPAGPVGRDQFRVGEFKLSIVVRAEILVGKRKAPFFGQVRIVELPGFAIFFILVVRRFQVVPVRVVRAVFAGALVLDFRGTVRGIDAVCLRVARETRRPCFTRHRIIRKDHPAAVENEPLQNIELGTRQPIQISGPRPQRKQDGCPPVIAFESLLEITFRAETPGTRRGFRTGRWRPRDRSAGSNTADRCRPGRTAVRRAAPARTNSRRKKQAGAEDAWTFQHERMRCEIGLELRERVGGHVVETIPRAVEGTDVGGERRAAVPASRGRGGSPRSHNRGWI